MTAIGDVVKQMQDVQKSVNSGDPTKALTTLNNAHSGFLDQADKLQKQFPSPTSVAGPALVAEARAAGVRAERVEG